MNYTIQAEVPPVILVSQAIPSWLSDELLRL